MPGRLSSCNLFEMICAFVWPSEIYLLLLESCELIYCFGKSLTTVSVSFEDSLFKMYLIHFEKEVMYQQNKFISKLDDRKVEPTDRGL